MSEVGTGVCQWQMKAKRSLQYLGSLSLVLCLASCDTQLQDLARRPASKLKPKPSDAAKLTPLPTPTVTKLKVTVDSIADLKVKEGSSVVKGQVISEPTETKQRIIQRRQAIQQQLAQLNALASEPRLSQATAQPSTEGVKQAQVRLNAAEAALAQYRKDSPYTDYALQNLPLPEEQVKLERLQGEVRAAQAALKQEQAVLARIKAGSPSQGQGLANLKATQASLSKELQQLETQDKALKVVYSPYTGLINKITPLNSNNGTFQFELSIAAQASPQVPSLPQDPQNPFSPQISPGSSTPALPLPTSPSSSSQDSELSLPPLPQNSPSTPLSQPPN
jgi:hypothetical protein